MSLEELLSRDFIDVYAVTHTRDDLKHPVLTIDSDRFDTIRCRVQILWAGGKRTGDIVDLAAADSARHTYWLQFPTNPGFIAPFETVAITINGDTSRVYKIHSSQNASGESFIWRALAVEDGSLSL